MSLTKTQRKRKRKHSDMRFTLVLKQTFNFTTLVDMDGVVLNDVLQGGLSGEESQFLLAQAGLTLLLLWR